MLLPTEGVDSSDGGEYLLGHSSSRSVLLLLLTGEDGGHLGEHCARNGQKWREGKEKEGKSIIFSKADDETRNEGGKELDENGQLVSDSSSNLVNITAQC